MRELVFEVIQDADGGYCAACVSENIFTQGDTWDELRNNVVEATGAFFFDRQALRQVRLHLVRRVTSRVSSGSRYLTTTPSGSEH
jgi:predicted RNase H-like HicB family nuclease